MRKRAFISTLMLLAGTAPAASAADLETVVVTATRSAQPAALTGESISVITADTLQRQQISFVNDALSQVPGLTSVRNGGVGQNATIGVRGAPAGQTLVLIDGVRINDASSTDGQALLAEVGQRTRRGGDAPVSGTALAEGGSFDTFHANAAVNGTVDGIEYGGAVNSYATNSVSAADARNGNSEADGYHNFGATGNVRVPVNDWASVDLRAYYARARGSFDGYPPPSYTFQDTHEFNRNTLFAGYAGLNITALDGRLHNRLGFMGSSSNRENFDPTMGPANNYFGKGSAARFEYQGVFDLNANNQIVFGAESEYTTFKTQSVFDFPPVPTLGARRITSGYGQWQTTLFEQLTLTGGIRYDGDSEFGGHTSLKFAGAWQLPDGATVLHANYGDGFKAPTLYEMYSQYSNPLHALAPETARGWEVGAARQFMDGDLSASLTWF
ncbi:MAG: TonB-dependent receptor, partial [Alphaproteobacteria bacterium]|nr:TonB-dependent receptor [Alphaproteobacteria bacterium]